MSAKSVKIQLILENGAVFYGNAFGYVKETVGEVVFNTGVVGYQEILTDPTYAGKIVCMTYPLIGNYGINLEDMESKGTKIAGLIVRGKCDYPNNWRMEMDLDGYLKQNKVLGMEGIDTRALTRILRDSGTMKGIITARVDSLTPSQISQKFSTYSGKNIVEEVTTKEKYIIDGRGLHLAVIDMGIKNSMLKAFQKRGCKLSVFPAFASAEEILESNPDGIFISNGPGDPKNIPSIIETVKGLIGKKPVVGVCTGHQIIAIALGCTVDKMKFGHHGGNHSVKNMDTGRCYITSQGHEFVVTKCTEDVEANWINVNDKTIEGIRHKALPVASVQFHPESCPGPVDTDFIFDNFLKIIEEGRKNHA